MVTLHRPSKRNVLSRAMVADLLRVWRQFEASDDVKCVVLRGSGDFPCLCAGGDVRAVHDLRPPPGEGDARRRAPPPGALEFFEREYEMKLWDKMREVVEQWQAKEEKREIAEAKRQAKPEKGKKQAPGGGMMGMGMF